MDAAEAIAFLKDAIDRGHLPKCRFYLDPDITWCWCPDAVDVRRNPRWYLTAAVSMVAGYSLFGDVLDALEYRETVWRRLRRRWAEFITLFGKHDHGKEQA